jgi:hypothetical protein
VDIQGTSSRIVIGNNICKLYKASGSKRFSGYKELEEIPFPKGVRINSFIGAFDDLVYSIRDGVEPVSSGIDGLRAIEVIYVLYESSEKGCMEIFVEH